MSLSEKRLRCGGTKEVIRYAYKEEDVKEAIKELKDICDKNDGYCTIDDINDVMGEKLT